MSVAEMKLKAINHLANLKTEESVKEILEQLEKLDEQENKTLNLAQHYPAIKQQYGSVLEKLAK
jgi:alpha-D-ribose 1-methylphosphonate 5-triphosphate diphosphatase PhnM